MFFIVVKSGNKSFIVKERKKNNDSDSKGGNVQLPSPPSTNINFWLPT